MIDKYRDKLDEEGVSPVIGVILLVAVTVAIVALAMVIVFDIGSGVSDTSDASVQMEQTDSGVQATIVRNENVDEFILRHEDGTEKRSTKSIGSFTYDNGDGEYTLIGVVGGNEEVIGSKTVVGAESGESSSVIEVGNLTQLQAMQGDLSAEYKLIRDIDASETETWNNGQGFNPIGSFTGSFDGQNNTISNLSINRLDDNYVGLFGRIDSSAEVENVGVINVNMTGSIRVGGLVGENYNGNISNSYSTGNVTGDKWYVGGLVGSNYGTVSNSYSTGNVTGESYVGGLVGSNIYGNISNSYSTGNVTGESNTVGGLVGYNYNGNISNSYSTGNVSGEEQVGGLVGKNDNGNISNSYSTGNVTGELYSVGGLLGSNSNNGTVSNSYATGSVSINSGSNVGGLLGISSSGSVSDSYWDIESTGQSSSAVLPDINGLTTSEMQGSSAEGNMNFDFTSTWSTVEGDYPELQWQE